jgi:choline dehydrogenase
VIIEFPFVTPELAEQIDVPENSYAIAPSVVRPASRGTVRLRSADPADEPLIDMNYMACDADIRAMLAGVEMGREMGQTDAFRDYRKRELCPGKRSRREMIEFIRIATSTYFHPAGTCKMGVDAESVVDPELRVYGVNGLRVADASIMPSVTTGNTNAPTVMIGEKAAEMILAAAEM